MTGREWTVEEMTAAVERGPHESSLTSEAIQHFAAEVLEKVATGQAKVVNWDDIKDNPPPQLKISPVAAIPHKSKAFRTILDLSFRLRLKDGGVDKNGTKRGNRPDRTCPQTDYPCICRGGGRGEDLHSKMGY